MIGSVNWKAAATLERLGHPMAVIEHVLTILYMGMPLERGLITRAEVSHVSFVKH
jgi:hypothetical protein